jgi:Uncharacterized membrane protein
MTEYIDYIYELLENTEITTYTAALKLFISFLLGAVIGVERQMRRRNAGMRTFTLIAMGSTVAMLISIWIPQCYPDFLNGDPGRIAAQALTGIGFLGAGAIIQSHGSVQGLTTAACIWVMAAVGLAVGAGMYVAAVITTFFSLFVLMTFERIEKRMYLAGVNKTLIITCSVSTPDLKLIRHTLKEQKVYIISLSYEQDYDTNTSIITYKVNADIKSSYSALFAEIRKLGYVSNIKLLA